MTVLRVTTVPDVHPYLAAVQPDSVRHHRLTASTTGWERSPLLDPSTLDRTLVGVDVVHVHFGYEGLSPATLQQFADGVHRSGRALVVTVHDLRNPHDRDPAAHLAHLDVLVATADGVITLTAGAAAQIARRWSRAATVIGHPTLLTPAQLGQPRPVRSSPAMVGIHLKSLRANVAEPLALVRAAAAGARDAGAVLRVDVHDPGADPTVLDELIRYADRGLVELHRHQRFSDDELLGYLRELDVSVLPYQFGSHSGWLELCRDLGVRVIAPDCGFYADQWDAVLTYGNNERTGLDAGSLREVVRQAALVGPPAPVDRRERLAQLHLVRTAHATVYADAVRHRADQQRVRS